MKQAKTILNKSGFTFVEAMIVIALFAIIGVSLFSSLSLGLKVWKRATQLNLVERKAILGLERLSTELRRTYNYPSIGFWGEKDHMEFVGIYRDEILNISYQYAPQEKCVYRSGLSMQRSGLTEGSPLRRVFLEVKNFTLSFYGFDTEAGTFTFFDSWNYTKSGIPLAVKVSLTLEDGKGFEKIVAIPIAQ